MSNANRSWFVHPLTWCQQFWQDGFIERFEGYEPEKFRTTSCDIYLVNESNFWIYERIPNTPEINYND